MDPLNEVLAHLDQVKGRDLNVASLLQVLPDGALNQERGGQVGWGIIGGRILKRAWLLLGLLRGLGSVGVGEDGLRDVQRILDESILVDQLAKEPLRY